MPLLADITLNAKGRPDRVSTALLVADCGPVVDAHHHFWDLDSNCYPWLQDQPVKAHFGDYAAIRRNYLPVDLRADIGEIDLAASIHVEAHWQGGTSPEGETQWLAEQASAHGLPDAIIGAANVCSPELSRVLNAHRQCKAFRGIRIMAMGRGTPEGAALYRDPVFQRGLSQLFDLGLCVDLQAPPTTHEAVADLADRFPEGRIAVIHCGLPLDRSRAGLKLWRSGITRLAQAQNVSIKLSGLAMTDWNWSCKSFTPLVQHLLAMFGPARIMFGSNFPVDGLFSDYPTLLAGYLVALGYISDSERRAIFHDTARRFYQLSTDRIVAHENG